MLPDWNKRGAHDRGGLFDSVRSRAVSAAHSKRIAGNPGTPHLRTPRARAVDDCRMSANDAGGGAAAAVRARTADGGVVKIAFFGSSLVSSYWNGAATYYRGLLKALATFGHEITYYEPDAYERQQHRDIADPHWARVVVYPATAEGWQSSLSAAARIADLLVKASGVGVFDAALESAVPEAGSARVICVYWDVDAPATLDAIGAAPDHHLRRAIPKYDMVLTYGGGDPVIEGYERVGAKICVPVYNALDPDVHYPVPPRPDLACDLSFL